MQACRAELTYTAEDIRSPDTTYIVADVEGDVAGFLALVRVDDGHAELDALFIHPDYIGNGIGRALLQRAIERARITGVRKLIIQADPNAESFYRAAGAVLFGERESASISGRMLPLYEIDL